MNNLYSTHAKEFSNSRQSPWNGWDRVIKNYELTIINKRKDGDSAELKGNKVLDLGCGNGRFLKSILKLDLKIESYLGLDNSDELLKIAEEEFININTPKVKFINLDLNENWNNKLQNTKYNLIVAFGLMHHLKTTKEREAIYRNSYELLEEGGVFCVTFWEFLKNRKLEVKKQTLGNEDYILPFGNSGATRFVHYTNNDEITRLEKTADFKLIDEYYSDGKENNQNLYKIYKK